jgi:hypothetical protein
VAARPNSTRDHSRSAVSEARAMSIGNQDRRRVPVPLAAAAGGADEPFDLDSRARSALLGGRCGPTVRKKSHWETPDSRCRYDGDLCDEISGGCRASLCLPPTRKKSSCVSFSRISAPPFCRRR